MKQGQVTLFIATLMLMLILFYLVLLKPDTSTPNTITFTEITELSKQCQFNDCTHVSEKGCAVLVAVEDGKLSKKRYQNYIKMHKESVYNEMSYLEKRQKDKQFGKLIKTVMKHKKISGST